MYIFQWKIIDDAKAFATAIWFECFYIYLSLHFFQILSFVIPGQLLHEHFSFMWPEKVSICTLIIISHLLFHFIQVWMSMSGASVLEENNGNMFSELLEGTKDATFVDHISRGKCTIMIERLLFTLRYILYSW